MRRFHAGAEPRLVLHQRPLEDWLEGWRWLVLSLTLAALAALGLEQRRKERRLAPVCKCVIERVVERVGKDPGPSVHVLDFVRHGATDREPRVLGV